MTFHEIHPLVAFTDPAKVWSDQPSFLVGEIVFTLLFLLCALHALTSGRKFILLWFACLFGGGCIELLTILEGEHIGNFYHSQAVIMLFGLREPFYMFCGCYVWIQ
jgi:uncharacterized membrane protein